jgi:C-methyltransferase C-terminal domain/Putative zinc binding domain/Methyltransferase domain
MKRTTCSACGDRDLDQFLDLGLSPVADAYTATADEISPMYPLEVAVCAKCKLVQLLEVLPSEVLFGTGYSFYSSASAPLSAYHTRYAEDVLARYGELAKKGVVEIGCNDGDFLRHFAEFPHIGFDPAEGPARVAMERGLNIAPVAFSLTGEHATFLRKAGLVIANHVLAHVEDVSDVMAGIASLCDDYTVVIIEVQYLPDLLVNNAFDLVYHEHRNFFSLRSLVQAASRYGLALQDAELTDRQGGSLRATFGLKPVWEFYERTAHLLKSEMWLDDFDAYAGMQGRAERIRDRLWDLIGKSRMVAMYGAPAKATTLLNFCGLTVKEISWCEDSTPAKQGRYIPGTGIKIFSSRPAIDRPTAYLLSAWNYADTIMKANPGNRWILPIPAPVVL